MRDICISDILEHAELARNDLHEFLVGQGGGLHLATRPVDQGLRQQRRRKTHVLTNVKSEEVLFVANNV